MAEKNAERRTRYKAAQKNQSEFLAEPTPTGAWAAIELRQMERQLALLLTNFAEWEKEVVYAELLAYARRVTPQFGRIFTEVREIGKMEPHSMIFEK
jgi:hypothetical protein